MSKDKKDPMAMGVTIGMGAGLIFGAFFLDLLGGKGIALGLIGGIGIGWFVGWRRKNR